jgi:Helix-turn-helix domain
MNASELRKLQKEVAEIKKILHHYKNQTPSEEWYDSADLKTHFHFSESKLYRLRKTNQIPYTKIGGRFYYPKRYFDAALLKKIENRLGDMGF